jgi:hypothetical protein
VPSGFDFSKINALLGIAEEKVENVPVKPKIVQRAKLPYFKMPLNNVETIVDEVAYFNAFHVPDVFSNYIHRIDPKATSIEELEFEKKVLEEKIKKFREIKLERPVQDNKITEKNKVKKNGKKKIAKGHNNRVITSLRSKKFKTESLTKNKSKKLKKKNSSSGNNHLMDIEAVERLNEEERYRLQKLTAKNNEDKENQIKILLEVMEQYEKEKDNLKNELTKMDEIKIRVEEVAKIQLDELDKAEMAIKNNLISTRSIIREALAKRFNDQRNHLKIRIDERKYSKMLEYKIESDELKWLLDMYRDSPDETDKINMKLERIEIRKEQFLIKTEHFFVDEEKKIDDDELEDEDKLTGEINSL